MKICPECECKNSDTATLCKDCGNLLSKVAIENYAERVRLEEAIREKQERRQALAKRAGVMAAAAIWLALAVTGFALRGGKFFPPFLFGCFAVGAGAIGLLFPDALFRFHHMCDIRNLDEVEPSDFYYFTNAIGSVMAIVAGIAFMGGMAFFGESFL